MARAAARRVRTRALRPAGDRPARGAAPRVRRGARRARPRRAGEHAELAVELDALVAAHPLREGLRAQQMLCLYRSGRQADALEAYREARSVLVERARHRARAAAAGAPPGDPRSRIRRSTPRRRRSRAGARDGRVRRPRRRARRARSPASTTRSPGAGASSCSSGEPGIGKSRLAEELIARAADARRPRARRALLGGRRRARPTGRGCSRCAAYVRETTRALRAQLGAGAADLAQIVPELRERVPDCPSRRLDPEAARFRLFDATAQFLRRAAREPADRPRPRRPARRRRVVAAAAAVRRAGAGLGPAHGARGLPRRRPGARRRRWPRCWRRSGASR